MMQPLCIIGACVVPVFVLQKCLTLCLYWIVFRFPELFHKVMVDQIYPVREVGSDDFILIMICTKY